MIFYNENSYRMIISSEKYGLNKRVILKQLNDSTIAIEKIIKSRIIQKDALKIIETVNKIKSVDPIINVYLICTSNICSKSIKLLEDNQINIIIQS